MECTQRLECTQDLYGTQSERTEPEQIGFLGICGTKYPIKKGPNKIGRDPQTCSVVLNLNSISRQHAVLNILSNKDFMLMDLDSANKTKLMGKPLPAYIPHAVHDGDTVQFGDVFGIFRVLAEECELPATQALQPHAPRTTVPESPDVSDRDDSFIIPSQPKPKSHFKSRSSNFIKSSAKSISIQPVGSHKIDNVFWNSAKKSTSLCLDDSTSLDDSSVSNKIDKCNKTDIHEMETQAFPNANDSTDSIYTAATQPPPGCNGSPSIHLLNTQLPENLPQVQNINDQQDMQFDLFTANKENDNSIYNAETQFDGITNKGKKNDSIFEAETQYPSCDLNVPVKSGIENIFEANTQIPEASDVVKHNKDDSIYDAATQLVSIENANASVESEKKSDISEEDILFDEINSQSFADDFYSQPIIPQDNDEEINLTQADYDESKKTSPKDKTDVSKQNAPAKRNVRIQSDSSTDCEDVEILPSQTIPVKTVNVDDDLTDCEEDKVKEEVIDKKPDNPSAETSAVDFEDMLTQVIEEDIIPQNQETGANTIEHVTPFEDLPTQVLRDEEPVQETAFEELATQVLECDIPNKTTIENKTSTQEYSQEIVSLFKVPRPTPIKSKRNIRIPDTKKVSETKTSPTGKSENNEDKFYEATQDIYNDLCTQPEIISGNDNSPQTERVTNVSKIPQPESIHSPSATCDDSVNNYVNNLTSSQIRTVVGADNTVSTLKRNNSDPSDTESTPKKVRSIRLMKTVLPDSQEIKTSVALNATSLVTDSSSDSETEEDSQDATPILFRRKTKPKINAKVDLTKKFDANILPSRIITRVRKPTVKLLNCDDDSLKMSRSLLKPKFLTEQDLEIDQEIINENLSRLKNKTDKAKSVSPKSENIKSASPELKNASIPNDNTSNKKLEEKREKRSRRRSKDLKDTEYEKSKSSSRSSKRTRNKPETDTKDKEKNTSNTTFESNKIQNVTESRKHSSSIITKEEVNIEGKKNQSVIEPKKNSSTRKIKVDVKIVDKKTKNVVESKNNSATKSGEEVNKTEPKTENKRSRSSRQKTKDAKPSKHESVLNYFTRNKSESVKDTNLNESTSISKDTFDAILSTSNCTKNLRSSYDTKNRSTRSRNKTKTEKTSVSPEREEKRTRGRPKRTEHKNVSPEKEIEVRRSMRQRVNLESSSKSVHEQSTVYNVSSETSVNSPKRKLSVTETDVPSAKRTRAAARDETSHRVLFTAFPCEEVKEKLEKLGAAVVSDVWSCSVVVTLAVRRTFKLLCALGLGRPVVGAAWLQACLDARRMQDPWQYLIKDTATEQRFQFDLHRTLSGPRGFLRGYNVSATPSVLPKQDEMKLIVECSGGTWRAGGPRWVCVSCAADKREWRALRAAGATLVTTEFILSGVLTQRVDIQGNSLPD